MSDTDIDFMDVAAAREYVLNFIISLKRTQKDRAVADEELEQWERRVKLADSRGEPILKRSAESRAAELKSRRQQLLDEERQLTVKVDVLKEKLRSLAVRSSLSVDADALLARLSLLVGDPALAPVGDPALAPDGDPAAPGAPTGARESLSRKLKEEEAAQALEELKRRVKEEGR